MGKILMEDKLGIIFTGHDLCASLVSETRLLIPGQLQ